MHVRMHDDKKYLVKTLENSIGKEVLCTKGESATPSQDEAEAGAELTSVLTYLNRGMSAKQILYQSLHPVSGSRILCFA